MSLMPQTNTRHPAERPEGASRRMPGVRADRRQLRRVTWPTSIAGMEDIYCFAGNPLDRASERRRDSEWIRSLLDDQAARVLPLRDLLPATRGGASPLLDWQPVAPWRELIEQGATLIFLGLADQR